MRVSKRKSHFEELSRRIGALFNLAGAVRDAADAEDCCRISLPPIESFRHSRRLFVGNLGISPRDEPCLDHLKTPRSLRRDHPLDEEMPTRKRAAMSESTAGPRTGNARLPGSTGRVPSPRRRRFHIRDPAILGISEGLRNSGTQPASLAALLRSFMNANNRERLVCVAHAFARSRAQIDAHCERCDTCRDLLSDLMEIRAAASRLDRLTPSPDMWNAIATKLQSRRAYSQSWVPLAAAAALVMILGTAAWFGLGSSLGRESPAELARNAASELQLAEQHYEKAIAALEQLTVNKETTLDAAVVDEIARSLQSIDRAITDSRAALRAEPTSFVAQTSLLEALRMKVALLQETVSLMNSRS